VAAVVFRGLRFCAGRGQNLRHDRCGSRLRSLFSAFVFIDFAVYFLYGNEQQL
jgi:hypothetical protein